MPDQPKQRSTLHMLCGKIASGKSTLAAQLSKTANTVVVSEDRFLAGLYPGEIITLEDYVRCAGRLREVVGPHIVDLLLNGVSVVLDFQANTVSSRAWMRQLAETAQARHQLHYLQAENSVCKARLKRRNVSGVHEYQVSNADFDLFTSHFVPPNPDEGFSIVLHEQR